MIPFFRKIRYRLANDNQFFNYSRCAIGKIVLVVIGILIALSINRRSFQSVKYVRSKLPIDIETANLDSLAYHLFT